MQIFQVVAISFVATILALILKKQNPEYSIYINLVTGILIFFIILNQLDVVINSLQEIAVKSNINSAYMKIILKIIGIAYITEFGSQICKDAGQGALGMKIEFAGKVMIFVVSLPILMTIIKIIEKLLT